MDSSPATKADSGLHSTYWPQLSDVEVPPLDIGWPDGGFYKGVTRVAVHTHPPKENGPHIKEVVRRLIQDSSKVIAVVMDMMTDLQILQDLLDAAFRRNVSVYMVLDSGGVPHFLDMCSRLQVGAMHLRNIRVRTVQGYGLPLSCGKLPGSLSSKYMLVDGDKVMFGTYSFTWSSARIDRNTITVMTGQVVDFFDRDFRELYAISENVDLYKEFHISKPPAATPVRAKVQPTAAPSASRFQVSLGASGQANLKVPAHKYYNPKYALVVGDTMGLTGSLQDLRSRKDSAGDHSSQDIMQKFLQSSSEKLDKVSPLPSASPEAEDKEVSKTLNGFAGKKQRSSFRLFLKGRGANQNVEAVQTPPKSSPTHVTADNSIAEEQEDKFEVQIVEKPPQQKGKNKKMSKLGQKSQSLMVVNTQNEDGSKEHRRPQKRGCVQS
ncbi:hypothetical protein MATL_G00003900 [Megalops atlanticus]|uniref:Scaffolding anchor of CK1 domain-containing protein n=1 Tax=Megalops atlanticus TaxID=7932 RepID=A0A9D3TH12_MEGAT|nr:hypothetical protein MATL_G00003900 [Megalops atlanticus]